MKLCRKNEAAKWQSFTMYREGYEGRGRTADEERPLQEENSLKSTCISPSGAKGMGGEMGERGEGDSSGGAGEPLAQEMNRPDTYSPNESDRLSEYYKSANKKGNGIQSHG